MKAKDLRIGNLVSVDNEAQYIIGIESSKKCLDDDLNGFETVRTNLRPFQHTTQPITYIGQCDGLPITKNNLENFGFYGVGSGETFAMILESENFTIDCIDNDNGYDVALFLFEHGGKRIAHRLDMPHIKYIHQIQNLYYSLSGNDLNKEMAIRKT